MKLIQMTDFVEEVRDEMIKKAPLKYKKALNYLDLIFNYSIFLKQRLELGMFVPVDEDGNLMEEPKKENYTLEELRASVMGCDYLDYNKAKEKVLFEGFTLIGKKHVKNRDLVVGVGFKNGKYQTIQDLSHYNKLIFTESAIKKIGLWSNTPPTEPKAKK